MKNLISKISGFCLVFSVVLVSMIVLSSKALAEDLPNCASIKAGSARCICEKNLVFADLVCEVGQYCDLMQTQTKDSYYSTYSCRPLDTAENSHTMGYGAITVISKDSHKYTPAKDICLDSCSPSCYYKQVKDCTFCDLFRVFFNTSSKIARQSINTFSGSVANVVIIAFALWIAVQILAFVSAIETRDFKDLAKSLLTQGFVVAFVVLLLQTGAFSFFNLALKPIFTTGMNIAEATIKPDDIISNKEFLDKARTEAIKKGAKFNEDDYKVICDTSGIVGYERGALPQEMGQSILCTMTLIQNRVAKIKALGSAGICFSWEKRRLFVIPHLGYFITGLGIWIGAIVMMIAIPFLMIDAVLELAVAAALLPAAIGAYAFKITRRYVKPVWDTFINAMFVFIFVSLLALMLTTVLEMVLIDTTQGSLDKLIQAGTDAQLEDFLKGISWWSISFLKICFALILVWTMLGEAKDFAGQFSGSLSSTAIGSSIGTMGMSFGKSAIDYTTKPLRKAAGDHLKKGAINLAKTPLHYGRKLVMRRQMNRIMRNSNPVTDQNGKTIYMDNTGSKVIVNADGSRNLELHKKSGAVKIKNKHFSVTRTLSTVNGKTVTREHIRYNSNAYRDLLNMDGTFNQKVYDQLLDGVQGEEAKSIKVAIAKQIVKKTMPNMKSNINNHVYLSQEPLMEDGQLVGYIEELENGTKIEVRFKKGKNNRLLTEYTNIDAGGKGIRLSTDGVINRKQKFTTKDHSAFGEIDESSITSIYSLSAYYHDYHKRGRYSRVAWGDSCFDEDTVMVARNYVRQKDEYRGTNMYEFSSFAD